MANDNRLNKTGLRYFLGKLAAMFAKQEDLTALSDRVDEIIAEGGEPNVIEKVKVAGTALTPDAQKAVDIPAATTSAAGVMSATDKTKLDGVEDGAEENVIETVKVNGTALTPDSNKAVDVSVPTVAKSGSGETEKVTVTDGQNAYEVPTVDAMEDYVSEHGGVIQKVKVNGTELSIDTTDKSVNIPAASSSAAGAMTSTDKSKLDAIEAEAQKNVQSDWNQTTTTADDFIKNKPTKLSDFTNDGDGTQGSTFPTTDEMDDAIAAQIGKVYQPKGSVAFANLPPLSASVLGYVYNVTDAFETTNDFKEGAGINVPAGANVAIINDGTVQNPVYKYDLFSGEIDLTDYWNTTNLPAITTAEIDEVWNSVFGSTP